MDTYTKYKANYFYEQTIFEINKKSQRLVFRHTGIFKSILYWQDNFNSMETVQSNILKKILEKKKVKNNEKKFYIYMRLSILAYESCEYGIEKQMLENAIEIRPDDVIANYKYALLLEYEGNVEKACFHYDKASKDPQLNSSEFKEFLNSEIKRIRIDGPKIRPKFSGLKYASY